MPTEELDKIQRFFAEGTKLWPVNAELVLTRHFFELWEKSCAPAPFTVTGNELTLAGQPLILTEDGDRRIAYCTWNSEEMTPVLMIEGSSVDQVFRLGFQDGQPLVEELPGVPHEDEEVSFGERMEVVYDLISAYRQAHPQAHVLEMSLKEFRAMLDTFDNTHGPQVMRVMKTLRAESMRRLLERAAEDMTADELGPQLTLPFGQSYASTPMVSGTPLATEFAGPEHGLRIPSRTPARCGQDLAFLAAACQAMAEEESVYLLSFEGAEVLWENDDPPCTAVRVTTGEDHSRQEGERLEVLRKGEAGPIATFILDLVDRRQLSGRILWSDTVGREAVDGNLVARPRRSPLRYLAGATAMMRQHFQEHSSFPAPCANIALGVEKTVAGWHWREGSRPPAHLDASQQRAWGNAVHPKNSVVLIQGPPGTGKTAVLEAVVRELCRQGLRILVTAPSNTAVDNICRRIMDLPVLRFGNRQEAVAPDVAESCWTGIIENVHEYKKRQAASGGGGIYAGTHVGCLRDRIIRADQEANGLYDAIVFDEAGMTNMAEFLLCSQLARRAILFGDHQQLPPFPLPPAVLERIRRDASRPIPRHSWRLITRSALEWLNEERQFPLLLLNSSYRCQNPRLMRFASTLFYDARVRASKNAEYYRLGYAERLQKYPPSTLRFITTSHLPETTRRETLSFNGLRAGLENQFEARLVEEVFYDALLRYPLMEISIITPYRRQIRLLREQLSMEKAQERFGGSGTFTPETWKAFLHSRVATVDSFQGGESDIVIISYVRSNPESNIGFVDDLNRVNVIHTRCRREMVVIGDLECLKRGARSNVFVRLERAIRRDGMIVPASMQ